MRNVKNYFEKISLNLVPIYQSTTCGKIYFETMITEDQLEQQCLQWFREGDKRAKHLTLSD